MKLILLLVSVIVAAPALAQTAAATPASYQMTIPVFRPKLDSDPAAFRAIQIEKLP